MSQPEIKKGVPAKQVSVEVHIDGGYVFRGTTNFDIPSGAIVDIFLIGAPDNHVKDDWYFNNEEVFNIKVDPKGKQAKLSALSPGTSNISFEKLGMKIKVNVIGKEAVGFKVTEIDSAV